MNPDELRRKFGRTQKREKDAASPEQPAADIKKSGASKMSAKKLEKSASEAPAGADLAEHTVASGDTLSGIAQKYYGSAAREKWMAIYEANRETIGDNPNLIRVGQTLRIPRLDE